MARCRPQPWHLRVGCQGFEVIDHRAQAQCSNVMVMWNWKFWCSRFLYIFKNQCHLRLRWDDRQDYIIAMLLAEMQAVHTSKDLLTPILRMIVSKNARALCIAA